MLSRIIELLHTHGRACVFGLALGALAIGLTAVVLAATLNLDACHLCIFQRLVFFILSAVLFMALAGWGSTLVRGVSLVLGGALSVWGMVVSAQQSWMQWYPQSGLSCDLAEVGFTNASSTGWAGFSQPSSWLLDRAKARIWWFLAFRSPIGHFS